ncbi:uncharacterized protein LOC125203243 [Salvia hispanica]|uniref:uncharacterized protein LOC125203243 n=1 Tax=Salvia hispanica TaxID=49212 RepID=UPI00200944DC|nr:uncharacterized protein LOC125203243 [Salvia hispanica]
MYDAYLALYFKNGKYTTKEAEEIDAKVKEIAVAQSEGTNLNDIYVNQVMGGCLDKKKRMLGTGVLGPMLLGSKFVAASTSNQQDAKWKSKMQQNLNEERERRMKLEEDVSRMQKVVDLLVSQQSHQSHQSSYSAARPDEEYST